MSAIDAVRLPVRNLQNDRLPDLNLQRQTYLVRMLGELKYRKDDAFFLIVKIYRSYEPPLNEILLMFIILNFDKNRNDSLGFIKD